MCLRKVKTGVIDELAMWAFFMTGIEGEVTKMSYSIVDRSERPVKEKSTGALGRRNDS
jgi:hypothetical protein